MKACRALLLLLIALPARGEVRPCTPAQLRTHLEHLQTVVASCGQKPGKAACNPALVGPDDKVSLPAGARMVRYDWLRAVLAEAAKKPKAIPDLKTATSRLNHELQELGSPTKTQDAELQRDRSTLHAILSSGEFPPPQRESLWQRLENAFFAWLNRLLRRTGGSGTHTRWVGILLIALVITAACGGLVWWFRRTVRSRVVWRGSGERNFDRRPVRESDWQVWLEEAQRLATEERWQEGIHRVYWAAVAQLESRGLWRHDAARTPREYLRLLATNSPMHGNLVRLTHCLEKFWYAGQQAGQQDYIEARELLDRLVKA